MSVAGQPVGVTQTITDVAQLALDHDVAARDHTIARAVVRRVLKKAAIYKAKDQLASAPWSAFALDASGFIWEATESADTRCWTTLPAMIQVSRCELPAGTNEVSLRPTIQGRPIGQTHLQRLQVVDGRNTYILACFPDERLSGKIVCSKGI